jgi:AraC-like DNA-binding protein
VFCGRVEQLLDHRDSCGSRGAAKEFIDRRVMLEAKRLLIHDELSAAQIATYLGFTSATNFTKFFRRHTGSSPGAFREAFMTAH